MKTAHQKMTNLSKPSIKLMDIQAFSDSILLLYKPVGITSNRALQKVKKILPVKKVGHAGTLDSFAEGLLVVMLGKATKLSSFFLNMSKSYLSCIHFGIETTTLDPEGEIVRVAHIPKEEIIREKITLFKGAIQQIPPQYSAIHINGERAYTLVRKGENPKMTPREVKVYENEIVKISGSQAKVFWHVSKGTYIRALARDLGASCDSCAHLSSLTRTQIGKLNISEAVSFEDLSQYHDSLPIDVSSKGHSSPIISRFKGFYSIESILDMMDEAYKIEVDDTNIRKKLVQGIQPLDLIREQMGDISENPPHVIYLCDASGLVGVWKYMQGDITHVLSM